MKIAELKITIIGGGNLGSSLAKGLVKSGKCPAKNITITRRNLKHIQHLSNEGFCITSDNKKAVQASTVIILAVLPQQFNLLVGEIKSVINPQKHLIISVVSGVSINDIQTKIGKKVPIVRAMPNTAIAIQESMTCIAANGISAQHLEIAKSIFETAGITMEINEEHMTAATALCACGIAFFLRAIRAASQGGIEIGFHADEALKMAAQTAKGAAALLLYSQKHPESEIDKVTSPEGCTIAGLNEMEHQGFSSALIKGIITSAAKAKNLYKK